MIALKIIFLGLILDLSLGFDYKNFIDRKVFDGCLKE
jgi:hypothetical protein